MFEGGEGEGAAGELVDEGVVDVVLPEGLDARVGEEVGEEVVTRMVNCVVVSGGLMGCWLTGRMGGCRLSGSG